MAARLLQSSEMWALVGVVLGFILGEGSRYARYRLGLVRKRCLLRAEPSSIREQIEQKTDIVRQIRAALSQRRLLPGVSVPILSVAYGAVI
jgi:hypothetical protein